MLASGDRVKVRGKEGRVVGAQQQDQVYVRLDGGTGCNFPVAEVEPLADAGTDVETKDWPPRGIETK